MYMPGPRNMVFQTNIPTQRYTSHVVINNANSGNIVYTNISNSNNITGTRVRNPARPTNREATSHREVLERLESLEDLEAPCAAMNSQIPVVSTEESATDEWVDVDLGDGEADASTSTEEAVPDELPPPYTARESTRAADAEPPLQQSATPECPGFASSVFQNGDVRREEIRLCTHETPECNNKREMIKRQQSTALSAQAPVPPPAPIFDAAQFRSNFPEWMQRYM